MKLNQIYNLADTLSDEDFDNFFEIATGRRECKISRTDLRACLMLFFNLKIKGVSVEAAYKRRNKGNSDES